MPEVALDPDEIVVALAEGGVVRVAFPDEPAPYVLPLGYVWDGSSMRGTGAPGHKTDLVRDGIEVGFQVDSSASTGLFRWVSVTGHGRFEIVEDATSREQAIADLKAFAAHGPEWWAEEQDARVRSGDLVVWSITPTVMTGRRSREPEGAVPVVGRPSAEKGILALDLMSAMDMLDATRREEGVRLAKVMISQFVLIPLFMVTAAQGLMAGLVGLMLLGAVEFGLFKFMTGLTPTIERLQQSVEEARSALEAEESAW